MDWSLLETIKSTNVHSKQGLIQYYDVVCQYWVYLNDRIGHLSGDAALAEAAERMRSVVRSADIPCRVGGDEFAVVMPESGLEQAEQLFHRLQDIISGRPIGQAGRLRISAGVAELKPDDDSVSFFERADQALYRAKDAGKGRAFTADGHAAA